ncbi:molecular chaperone TorD family protein [Chloroflexi bacterium TSY]|nr:molecular chaperone TorD family protein [Chloroflexi bacterium TSY]
MSINLSARETAEARGNLYTLLSQVILCGVTARQLPILQQIDELAAVLPAPVDLDCLMVEHEALFGLNVFPYESLYLDRSAMIGGAVTTTVLSSYQRVGYQTSSAAPSADHLGEELRLLAFLCGAEADAREDQIETFTRRMMAEQRRFLEEHLLRWLFPCIQTIRSESSSIFAVVAELIQDLVLTHYTDLVESSPPDWIQPPFTLPHPPSLLTDEQTSLHDIATYLSTPVWSGFGLTRSAVVRLGREQQLPRGFGNRVQMLTNLMRSAAQYDGIPILLMNLRQMIDEKKVGYQQLVHMTPSIDQFVTPWLKQIRETDRLLEEVEKMTKSLS